MSEEVWSKLKKNHAGTPPLIVIHGAPGAGKTSFACISTPNPIVLATENGLGRIKELEDIPAMSISSWEDMHETLGALCTSGREQGFQTVVLDSLDHLEGMIWRKIAQQEGKKSVDEIPYGKGYALAMGLWRELMDALEFLRSKRGFMIILIAHSHAAKVNPPDMPMGYTIWDLKLHKLASEFVREKADLVGFAVIPLLTQSIENGFGGEKKAKVVGVGDRRLYTQPGGGFLAKSRWNTPDYVPLMWSELAKHLTGIPS
jgi:hypothetical protein